MSLIIAPKYDDIKNIRQFELDALAAQLVRQVDALDPAPRIMVDWEDTVMIVPCGQYDADRFAVGMSGRTMNTIRAIVDSGVLS